MDAAALKVALLQLLADDPAVRAAVLALVDQVRLKADDVGAVREAAAASAPPVRRRAAPPWLQR